MIRMIVAPFEVFPLPSGLLSIEFAVVPALFPQVDTIGTIFLIVPGMIISAVTIVVSFIVMIVTILGSGGQGSHQGCPGGKQAQNEKPTH
jgi:hypothetical protein